MTDGNPVAVFRTTSPDVLQRVAERHREIDEWVDMTADYAKSVTGDERVWVSQFLDHRYISGLTCDVNVGLPKGWRRNKDEPDCIVPDRRTKIGKEAAKRFAELRSEPSLRAACIGMPREIRGAYNPYTGGIIKHTFGLDPDTNGRIEVTWSVEVPDERVDLLIWTRIPLSQWHAEHEGGAPGGT